MARTAEQQVEAQLGYTTLQVCKLNALVEQLQEDKAALLKEVASLQAKLVEATATTATPEVPHG